MKSKIQEKKKARRQRREKVTVMKITSDLWQAPSSSDPETSHVIYWNADFKRWECDCIGFKIRRWCKHADRVTKDSGRGTLNPKKKELETVYAK